MDNSDSIMVDGWKNASQFSCHSTCDRQLATGRNTLAPIQLKFNFPMQISWGFIGERQTLYLANNIKTKPLIAWNLSNDVIHNQRIELSCTSLHTRNGMDVKVFEFCFDFWYIQLLWIHIKFQQMPSCNCILANIRAFRGRCWQRIDSVNCIRHSNVLFSCALSACERLFLWELVRAKPVAGTVFVWIWLPPNEFGYLPMRLASFLIIPRLQQSSDPCVQVQRPQTLPFAGCC